MACRALEDELAHVLSEEREVRRLIIVNNLDCFDLSGKLRSKNRLHLLAAWEDIPEMLNGIRRTGPGMLKPLLERSRLCGLLGKAGSIGER
jgi:hypothetical protein